MESWQKLSIRQRVYDYLENQSATYDEVLADLAAQAIKAGIVRQIMKDRDPPHEGSMRCSASGPCARKVAYKYLGTPLNGKELTARSKITFLNGDFLEVVTVMLIRLAGIEVHNTCLDPDGQQQIYFKVNDEIVVPGSGDGILPIQYGLDEPHFLEIKSCSDWAFKNEFSKGVISDGYRLQHNVYLDAAKVNKGIFVATNKNTGELIDIYTEYDPEFVSWAKYNFYHAVHSTPDCLPERYEDGEAYGLKTDKKTGLPVLAALCGYCDYYKTCWPDTRIEIRGGKPVIFVDTLPDDYHREDNNADN